MRKPLLLFSIPLLAILLFASSATGAEVAGITLEPAVSLNGKSLSLNGFGVRKKFFLNVYAGALYTAKRVSTVEELLRDRDDKLVRMQFLRGVSKEKITDAFAEGFRNNSPAVAGTAEAGTFLSFFKDDFRKGDVVDLVLGADGAVSAKRNGKVLGTIGSPKLAEAILLIYVGPRPADPDLKKGLLGGR